jgi:hypothetical protein
MRNPAGPNGLSITRIRHVACSLFAALCASQAHGGEAANVRITQFGMTSNLGNHVFLQVSGQVTGVPACSTHPSWHFLLPLDTNWGKNAYAALLAARASGATMHISGTNTCSVDGTIETLRSFTVYE